MTFLYETFLSWGPALCEDWREVQETEDPQPLATLWVCTLTGEIKRGAESPSWTAGTKSLHQSHFTVMDSVLAVCYHHAEAIGELVPKSFPNQFWNTPGLGEATPTAPHKTFKQIHRLGGNIQTHLSLLFSYEEQCDSCAVIAASVTVRTRAAYSSFKARRAATAGFLNLGTTNILSRVFSCGAALCIVGCLAALDAH